VGAESFGGRPGHNHTPSTEARGVVPIRIDPGKHAALEVSRKIGKYVGIPEPLRISHQSMVTQSTSEPKPVISHKWQFVIRGGIKAVSHVRVIFRLPQPCDEIQASQPGVVSHLLPALYELCCIRKLAGLIDAKERFAGNSNVPRVFEGST
jgi:hypothetical protein